jgi:hypothetical protein
MGIHETFVAKKKKKQKQTKKLFFLGPIRDLFMFTGDGCLPGDEMNGF